MYKFSSKSKKNLESCHQDLQRVFNEVIKITDCSVICGHRSEEEQNEAFENGRSHLKWPKSNHNNIPSRAVDVAPYPIDWNDINRFFYLSGVVFTIANQLNIQIAWGGHWKSLKDYPHFELKE